jgi:hypothetical protein
MTTESLKSRRGTRMNSKILTPKQIQNLQHFLFESKKPFQTPKDGKTNRSFSENGEEEQIQTQKLLMEKIKKKNKLNIYIGGYDTYANKNPVNIEKFRIFEGNMCSSYFIKENYQSKKFEGDRHKFDIRRIVNKQAGIFIPNDYKIGKRNDVSLEKLNADTLITKESLSKKRKIYSPLIQHKNVLLSKFQNYKNNLSHNGIKVQKIKILGRVTSDNEKNRVRCTSALSGLEKKNNPVKILSSDNSSMLLNLSPRHVTLSNLNHPTTNKVSRISYNENSIETNSVIKIMRKDHGQGNRVFRLSNCATPQMLNSTNHLETLNKIKFEKPNKHSKSVSSGLVLNNLQGKNNFDSIKSTTSKKNMRMSQNFLNANDFYFYAK